MQGSEEPVQIPMPSSDEETEGEAERQVAMEAKSSQSRAHLVKSLELLGVFPTGIERGYCIIPRSSTPAARKRRVVQIVVEDAHIGSTVLALWNDNHSRPGAAAAAAFSGATPKNKNYLATDSDHGDAKFWPATIKRFTGEYVGLTDLADGALRSFADFDLVEDHANTLPFFLCVDIAFIIDETESRQRLVWSADHNTSTTDVLNSVRSPVVMSPKSSGGGPLTLLPSNLPSVVSVRNYSVVDALRGGDYRGAHSSGGRRASSMVVENPMVGGPISANDIVFERAHKSRRFTVLTVRDAGVVVQAKQQALRDLRDRWRRARASLPALSPKASHHSLGGSVSQLSELLTSSRHSSQAALRTPEPASVTQGGGHRRRLIMSGDAAAPPAPPSFVSCPTINVSPKKDEPPLTAAQTRSFVDLRDVGTAPSYSTRSVTPPQGAREQQVGGSVCESPPRSDRLQAKSQVNAPRHDRRAQSGADVVAIPRLQGASVGVAQLAVPAHDAHQTGPHPMPPPRRESEQTLPHHQRPLQGHAASILVSSEEHRRSSVSPRSSPHHLVDDDDDALVEEKVEQLEEELSNLRRLLHERSRLHQQTTARPHRHSPTAADAPLPEADVEDQTHQWHAGSASDDCGASPAPVPRGDVPLPRTQSPASRDKEQRSPKHRSQHQHQPQRSDVGSGGVKLWRKAQDQSFPPNSYVYVDPNARSTSPFDASGRSQLPQQRERGGGVLRTNQRAPLANGGVPSTRHEQSGASPTPTLTRTPRSAIAIDAHYHRSLAYKETVRRAMEDVKKKGLDVVRKQQKHHAELFRRDTRELDSSPVLQRKQRLIENAERSASRSPLGSRTPSVASRGGVSPFRGTSPTHPHQTHTQQPSSDVFARLSQPSATKAQTRAAAVYVPPPPIGRSASATRGIVAAVSSGARVRRSISPDFDVTAPIDDDQHEHLNERQSYNRLSSQHQQPPQRSNQGHQGQQEIRQSQHLFHMPTLARGFQS
jgi:hypothetical protein